MNHFQADWHTVIIGSAIILAAVAGVITYWVLERRRMTREDQMLTARMWPVEEDDPEGWLADMHADEEPAPEPAPVRPEQDETIIIPAVIIPPSDVSGPLPTQPMRLSELDTSLSADDFIRQMELVTSRFLIRNEIPA